jgi:uridine kinase
MTRWVPQKTDVLDALADEVLHNYGRGRALIAVDGHSADTFADEFAAALAARGRTVERATLTGPVATTPDAPDVMLVVDGPSLLRPELRGRWNFSVWLDGGERDSASRSAASAIVDNSDAEHPRRVFADSC